MLARQLTLYLVFLYTYVPMVCYLSTHCRLHTLDTVLYLCSSLSTNAAEMGTRTTTLPPSWGVCAFLFKALNADRYEWIFNGAEHPLVLPRLTIFKCLPVHAESTSVWCTTDTAPLRLLPLASPWAMSLLAVLSQSACMKPGSVWVLSPDHPLLLVSVANN